MSALEERRQRAREAGWDAASPDDYTEIPDIDVAIETATRVRITDEVMTAFARTPGQLEDALAAAFRAAGFIVEG